MLERYLLCSGGLKTLNLSMFNFMPDPNSTASIAQQMQDYENWKFLNNPTTPLLIIIFIAIVVASGILVFLNWKSSKIVTLEQSKKEKE
jgi:hypothetical protein